VPVLLQQALLQQTILTELNSQTPTLRHDNQPNRNNIHPVLCEKRLIFLDLHLSICVHQRQRVKIRTWDTTRLFMDQSKTLSGWSASYIYWMDVEWVGVGVIVYNKRMWDAIWYIRLESYRELSLSCLNRIEVCSFWRSLCLEQELCWTHREMRGRLKVHHRLNGKLPSLDWILQKRGREER
jgi:hypothetical protein